MNLRCNVCKVLHITGQGKKQVQRVDAFFAFFERFKDISFSLGECQEQDLNMIILKSFNAQPLSFIYIPLLFIQM